MPKNILVFKTSVVSKSDVLKLEPLLDRLINQNETWNFDLEDCDRILRIETSSLRTSDVIKIFERTGFFCAELEDFIPA